MGVVVYVVLQERDAYELDHLDFRTVAQCPYLEGEEPFKHVFIFHSNK